MAIVTQEQSAALDAWSNSNPAEAAAFFRRLNQKLGPSDDPEELIKRFQIVQPALWTQFITTVVAQFSATQADVEREVGRQVLGTSPRIVEVGVNSEAAEDESETIDVALMQRQIESLRSANQTLRRQFGEATDRVTEAREFAAAEYVRGVEDGLAAATAEQQRRNSAQQLHAVIFNECSRDGSCENNVRGGAQGVARALALIEQLEARGIRVDARNPANVLLILAEARRIAQTNVAYPSPNSIDLAIALILEEGS